MDANEAVVQIRLILAGQTKRPDDHERVSTALAVQYYRLPVGRYTAQNIKLGGSRNMLEAKGTIEFWTIEAPSKKTVVEWPRPWMPSRPL